MLVYQRGFLAGILISVVTVLSPIFYFYHLHIVYAATAPSINGVTVAITPNGSYATEVNLTENSLTSLYAYGTFSDLDGCNDVKANGTFSMVFYRSGVGVDCSQNSNNCYRGTYASGQCVITGCDLGTELTANYDCTISLQHYTDATDSGQFSAENWIAFIKATDGETLEGTSSNTTEINSLLALNVSSNMNYGTLAVGATSTELTVSIANTGNRSLDINASGTDMSCTRGSIVATQQRYDISSGNPFYDITPLTTSSVRVDMNISPNTNSALYFQLVAPVGVAGACNGVNTFIGVVDN